MISLNIATFPNVLFVDEIPISVGFSDGLDDLLLGQGHEDFLLLDGSGELQFRYQKLLRK